MKKIKSRWKLRSALPLSGRFDRFQRRGIRCRAAQSIVFCLLLFLLTSCGTIEISFDVTSTPEINPDITATAASTPAQPTSTQVPATPTITQFVPTQTSSACANKWFFDFDADHLPLAVFCPAPVKLLEAIGEDFEGGRAYRYAPDPEYTADQRGTVYVIYNDGEWVTFPDTWDSSQPSSDPSLVPPEGRYQPVDSIGKVWREVPEVRERLGWAYEPQRAFQGRIQPYLAEPGLPSGDSHFTFIDHGKWNLVLLLNSVDMGPNTWEVAGTYP